MGTEALVGRGSVWGKGALGRAGNRILAILDSVREGEGGMI